MTTPTPLPEALLRDTCARMVARYTTWPRSFEEVMAYPMRGRLVQITAVRRAKAVLLPAAAPQAASACRTASVPLPARKPHPVDLKRLAAGDRDD